MAEVKRIRTYYEGDDDRVILEGLQALQLLPANCEIARRSRQHPGKDGLVHDLAPFVRPANGVGGSAIVLVDLDHLTPDELFTWFGKQLAEEMKEPGAPPKLELKRSDKARSGLFSITSVDRIGQVALVPVGAFEDEELRKSFLITRFAIDDHVLRLVREQAVFEAVSELEHISYDLAMRKMTEVVALLRTNGITIQHTKRYLHILRAVAAVRPSSATFIDRLMKKATDRLAVDKLRAIFHPLIGDLEEAVRLLSA